VWILVVASLLAGIVALNVGVLRLNMEAERLDEQRNELVARRDALSAELSRSAAAGRIEAIALNRLGLVRPDQTTYVRLARARNPKGN
jgi:cell division protein FtsL